ncbi:MAG: hypothetical protein ACREUL_18960 [Steroidobacteraceae bacterium]
MKNSIPPEFRELHEWMQKHKPQEIAELVAKMSPEERVRVQARMSVLKDWLAEFPGSLGEEK